MQGFDFTRFHQEYAARLEVLFTNPDYEALRQTYGEQFSDGLRVLYDLRKKLLLAPIEIRGDRSSLFIQYFMPLSHETIATGLRYQRRHFPFAVNIDGDTILFSASPAPLVSVCYAGTGVDIEELPFTLQMIVNCLSAPE